jgi:hypothetical protein
LSALEAGVALAIARDVAAQKTLGLLGDAVGVASWGCAAPDAGSDPRPGVWSATSCPMR